MMTPQGLFTCLDWPLLREQKSYCENEAANSDEDEIYGGLYSLICTIQDIAVGNGLASQDEVYGVEE